MATRKQRRNFTGEQKVALIRKHLIDKVPVSDICEEYDIHISQYYQWQTAFFEGGANAFDKDNKKQQEKSAQQLSQLKGTVTKKDSVIAELVEENIKLKKENGLI